MGWGRSTKETSAVTDGQEKFGQYRYCIVLPSLTLDVMLPKIFS